MRAKQFHFIDLSVYLQCDLIRNNPMRLGQLARKLTVRTADIVEFLATKNIQIEEGANTRVEADNLQRVIQHFAPHLHDELLSIPEEETAEEVTETPAPAAVLEVEETAQQEPVYAVADVVDDTTSEPVVAEEKPELIKAPKVELAGLKVLGKIELPQPKKKEIKPEEETAAAPEEKTTSEPVTPRRHIREGKKNFRQERQDNRPRKNPVAVQREREQREAELKRQEEIKREKERKTLYYQNRVKASVPTKPMRMVNEPVVEMSEHDMSKTPKTWLGKFWKWFRS
jgi:hypothetical protein